MRPVHAVRPDLSTEEAELVLRVRAGDQNAFRPLVERYQGRIFNLCLRLLGRRSDAEDAAQDAFLRAFDALPRYDVARPFSAWLVEIAVNGCRDRRRSAWWRQVVFGDDTMAGRSDPTESADHSLSRAESLGAVVAGLAELKPREREALALFSEELPASESARILGITVNALYVRQSRARARLVEIVRESHPELFDEEEGGGDA